MSKFTYVDGRLVVNTSAPADNGKRPKDTTTWYVIDGSLRTAILAMASEDGIAVGDLTPTEKGRVINTYVAAWVQEGMSKAKTLRTPPAEEGAEEGAAA